MSPLNLVRFFRISFFVRCVTRPHYPTLRAVFLARHNKRSWLRGVCNDLKYISTFSAEDFSSCMGWSLSRWVQAIRASPQSFVRKIKVELQCIEHAAHSIPKGLQALHVGPCDAVASPSYVCSFCSDGFASKQQCNLHMNRRHGWIHEAHFLIDGVSCPICLQLFWSRSRVLEHIMYKSKRCFRQLLMRGPIISRVEVTSLLRETAALERSNRRAGYRRAHAHQPVVQLVGPRLPMLPM
eukprot:6650780-Karenia_brevis.AAC.1